MQRYMNDEAGMFGVPDGEWVRHQEAAKLIADRDAEIERLRADLVWAVEHCTNLLPAVKLVAYNKLGNFEGVSRKHVECDGTPESICRAVREARDGVR